MCTPPFQEIEAGRDGIGDLRLDMLSLLRRLDAMGLSLSGAYLSMSIDSLGSELRDERSTRAGLTEQDL